MVAAGLKPFFCFYGGKWRAAPRYPAPMYSTIIEPFAGAAGYACRYPERNVYLYDVDPVIAGLWQYLIDVSEDEIRALPDEVTHVDDLDVAQGAKWLIGFWCNKGSTGPRKSPSKWMREGGSPNSFWGPAIKERVASQLHAIRHWKVACATYEMAPNRPGTWFVDPPYNNKAGSLYRFSNVNYAALAAWCRTRNGQLIACEQDGADWLPFQSFGMIRSTSGSRGKTFSAEAIYAPSNVAM